MKRPASRLWVGITIIMGLILIAALSGCQHTGGNTEESPPPQAQSQEKEKRIEEAVINAIKSKGTAYAPGETVTEGYIILDTEEVGDTVKVYTVSSIGAFGFENGIFTKISGSGAIPTVMIFSKKEDESYSLLEYKEPLDGAGYTASIKEMFPVNLQQKVLSTSTYYPDLVKQQEAQAAEYLKNIGRTAEVNASHVEKTLLDINVEDGG